MLCGYLFVELLSEVAKGESIYLLPQYFVSVLFSLVICCGICFTAEQHVVPRNLIAVSSHGKK